METMLDRFMDELTRGIYKGAPQATYTPTLIVGLGGTGLKVLRHLKKALLKNEEQQIRLLGVDSDDSENNKFPELPPLDPGTELAILDADASVRALARAEEGFASAEHILDYLPQEHPTVGALHHAIREKIQENKGAGQLRRAGKLLFNSNIGDGINLDRKLRTIRSDLVGLSSKMRIQLKGTQLDKSCQVYVVSSLAGGTGAGCLVDMLGLLRTHFDGPMDKVTAICLLPGKALDKLLTKPREEQPNTRGNTIAILRELEAFMLGKLGDYTFHFDSEHSLTLGTKSLVNTVYLLGDVQWDNTEIVDWMDLCQAASYLLYGVVGTGVGSSKQAGAVNHDASIESRNNARPRVFNTAGVGVLEYPIDEIGHLAMRVTAQAVMERWLGGRLNQGEAKKTFNSLKNELSLASLSDLEAAYKFNSATVSESRYLAAATARKSAMKKHDDEFVGRAEAAMAGIDGHLTAYDSRLARVTEEALARFEGSLRSNLCTLMTGNQHQALQVAQFVCDHLTSLRGEFDEAVERRVKDTKETLARYERYKKEVHRLDFGLDILFRQRQGLITEVNRYLSHRLAAHLEEHVAGLLTAMEQLARNLLNEAHAAHTDLKNLQLANNKQMEELLERVKNPGFVQHAMDMSQISAWVDELNMPLAESFEASALDAAVIMRQALDGVEGVIRAALQSISIESEMRKRTPGAALLKRKVEALETASVPLIRLVQSAPGLSELSPQAFVVSQAAKNMAEAIFEAPAGGSLAPVDITNQHFVMYLRVLHEFAISDWSEYANALAAYKKKPWYYHALPDSVKLPND
jgi:hypothetical protein